MGCNVLSEATRHVIDRVLLPKRGGKDGLRSKMIRTNTSKVEGGGGILRCGLPI